MLASVAPRCFEAGCRSFPTVAGVEPHAGGAVKQGLGAASILILSYQAALAWRRSPLSMRQ